MRQPEHLGRLLTAVKSAVSIPLTLKIRAGWDSKSVNAIEIAKIAEDSGVSMLAIHGRTRVELYRGDPDWNIVQEVSQSIGVPVVGSGNVVDADSARQSFERGCKALMIGRAALYNPWVFSEIAAGLQGEEFQRPSDQATVDVLERYICLLEENFHPKAILGRLKQMASQITRRVAGSKEMRRKLCTCSSVEEFRGTLKTWRDDICSNNVFDLPLPSYAEADSMVSA